MQSPKKVSQPTVSLVFGSFVIEVDLSSPDSSSDFPKGFIFRSPKRVLRKSSSAPDLDHDFGAGRDYRGQTRRSPRERFSARWTPPDLNSNTSSWASFCSRCLYLGHHRNFCRSRVRCNYCLRLGHFQKACRGAPGPDWRWLPKAQSTQAEPKIRWRPKIPYEEKDQACNLKGGDLNSRRDASSSPDFSTPNQEKLQENPPSSSPSPSPNQENPTEESPSEANPIVEQDLNMANFLVNPQPYLVAGLTVEDG